jgi:hypothetical protein
MGLPYITIVMLRNDHSMSNFFKTFSIKECWIFQTLFRNYWDNHVILGLILFMHYIVFPFLCLLTHPFIPYYIIDFGLQVFYWGFLHICSWSLSTCIFLFLLCPYLVLVSKRSPFISILWNSLRSTNVPGLIHTGSIQQWICPVLFFAFVFISEKCFKTVSISSVIDLFRFFF